MRLILTIGFIVTPLFAKAGNRVALVIGNQDYRHQALDTPVNDAVTVANKLKKLGFTVVPVGKNLNRSAMLKKVRTFRQQISRNTEIALFYYAGHGAQYNNESYLIPLQANLEYANDLPIEAVKAKDILNLIEEQNAKVNVMILDACRDLPLERTHRGKTRGLAKMESHSSTLIAYSTKAGDVAEDKGNSGIHSPYTEVLLQYLDQPNLPLTQLFNDVSYAVYQQYQQEPWISSSRVPRIYLSSEPQQSAPQVADITQQPIPQRQETGEHIGHYIAYANGTALDTKSGLMWQRCSVGETWNGSSCTGEPKRFTWDEAMQLSSHLAGYSDWRLPTIDELGTLTYCSSGKPKGVYPGRLHHGCEGSYEQPTINTTVFPMQKQYHYWSKEDKAAGKHLWRAAFYWSSSPFVNSSDYAAWGVDFYNGFANFSLKNNISRYVRLVRRLPPGATVGVDNSFGM